MLNEKQLRARRLGGKIQGPRNKFKPHVHRLGGLVAGRRNRDSGHIQQLGQRNVKSGLLDKIRTPASAARGGVAANHLRWHVRRHVVNPRCPLCREKKLRRLISHLQRKLQRKTNGQTRK